MPRIVIACTVLPQPQKWLGKAAWSGRWGRQRTPLELPMVVASPLCVGGAAAASSAASASCQATASALSGAEAPVDRPHSPATEASVSKALPSTLRGKKIPSYPMGRALQQAHRMLGNRHNRQRPQESPRYGMCAGVYGICTGVYGMCTGFSPARLAPRRPTAAEAAAPLRGAPLPETPRAAAAAPAWVPALESGRKLLRRQPRAVEPNPRMKARALLCRFRVAARRRRRRRRRRRPCRRRCCSCLRRWLWAWRTGRRPERCQVHKPVVSGEALRAACVTRLQRYNESMPVMQRACSGVATCRA